MTTSPNEPLEYGGPSREDLDDETANEEDERLVAGETELAAGGYDDRQEDLTASDRDLFKRKERNPDARYKPEDAPLSEPRDQPRHADLNGFIPRAVFLAPLHEPRGLLRLCVAARCPVFG